ncbi:hypothetical protein AVEN_183479-1 [Araneus ventricosus]|uniref:Uncharacterized protein n=1 Tax=Araneus ventricosus TaxID=182803 RepID=A0A4Y1ZK51_ARAVE|nr:hypothetical protein AVEN_183479-1 [Araneus ventricosus]
MSRFEATQGLFWTGPPQFELWSDDEDDTSPPLQTFTPELSWSFATALLHANGMLALLAIPILIHLLGRSFTTSPLYAHPSTICCHYDPRLPL